MYYINKCAQYYAHYLFQYTFTTTSILTLYLKAQFEWSPWGGQHCLSGRSRVEVDGAETQSPNLNITWYYSFNPFGPGKHESSSTLDPFHYIYSICFFFKFKLLFLVIYWPLFNQGSPTEINNLFCRGALGVGVWGRLSYCWHNVANIVEVFPLGIEPRP